MRIHISKQWFLYPRSLYMMCVCVRIIPISLKLNFLSQEFDSPPCPARSSHPAGECEETTEFDRCRSPTGDDFGGGSTQQSSECGSAAPVTVSLPEALGKILAEEICAPDPLPPYPASIKDGYAVIASDGPGEYPVITESRAGNDGVGVNLTPGTVAYVTTGGPIPDGADAVVQVEDTEQLNDPSSGSKRVRILVQVSKGVDIRPVGCDIEKDAAVLSTGERIGVSEIGLLATVGVMAVKVYPKPTIAVLSTGDELVEPMTGSLNRGQIRDSNRAMLLAAAMQQECKVIDLGIVNDDEEQLGKILDNAFASGIDILLTSGGVSMGDRDFVKPLLEKKGTLHFGKVCMRPGKPLTFAEIELKSVENTTRNKVLAFGLPGNPVIPIILLT